MNRRQFIFGAMAVLATAFDPERLLWVPGNKLISIPSGKVLAIQTLTLTANHGFEVGDVVYVSMNGNDSTGKPFRTVKAAITAVKPGGCIYIMPGVYPEPLIEIPADAPSPLYVDCGPGVRLESDEPGCVVSG